MNKLLVSITKAGAMDFGGVGSEQIRVDHSVISTLLTAAPHFAMAGAQGRLALSGVYRLTFSPETMLAIVNGSAETVSGRALARAANSKKIIEHGVLQSVSSADLVQFLC